MFKIFPDVETMIISIGLILIFMWGVSRCNEKQRELTGKAAQIGLESPPRAHTRVIDTASMGAVGAAVAAATASTPKPPPPKTPAQVQLPAVPQAPVVVALPPTTGPAGPIPTQYVLAQPARTAPTTTVTPPSAIPIEPQVVVSQPVTPPIKLVPMHPTSGGLTPKGAVSAVSAQGAVVAPSGPTLYVTIENLNLRTQSNVSGKLLGRLKLYEPVTFLNEVTETTQQVTLANGEVTNEPWIKIRTQKGVSGWVYGAGISFYKKKR
jgi:Bacterial SH3 domain